MKNLRGIRLCIRGRFLAERVKGNVFNIHYAATRFFLFSYTEVCVFFSSLLAYIMAFVTHRLFACCIIKRLVPVFGIRVRQMGGKHSTRIVYFGAQ